MHQRWGTKEFLAESGMISEISQRYVVDWFAHRATKTAFFQIDVLPKFTTKLKFPKQSSEFFTVYEVGKASVTNLGQLTRTLPTIWGTSVHFVHIADISDLFSTFSASSIIGDLLLLSRRASFIALQALGQFPVDGMHIVVYSSTNRWSLADYSLTTSQWIIE